MKTLITVTPQGVSISTDEQPAKTPQQYLEGAMIYTIGGKQYLEGDLIACLEDLKELRERVDRQAKAQAEVLKSAEAKIERECNAVHDFWRGRMLRMIDYARRQKYRALFPKITRNDLCTVRQLELWRQSIPGVSQKALAQAMGYDCQSTISAYAVRKQPESELKRLKGMKFLSQREDAYKASLPLDQLKMEVQ